MNSIRREHWDQARAFEDYIGKLNEDTETAALLRPWYSEWARSKDFEKEDEKTIWKLVLFNRRANKRKKIRPFNKEKRERMRGKHTYGPYHRWISTQQCILAIYPDHTCMQYPDGKWVKGHHVKTVGSGGRDFLNEVPVCMLAHALCETTFSKVERKFGISLREVAEGLAFDCPKDVYDQIGVERFQLREYENGDIELIEDEEE